MLYPLVNGSGSHAVTDIIRNKTYLLEMKVGYTGLLLLF